MRILRNTGNPVLYVLTTNRVFQSLLLENLNTCFLHPSAMDVPNIYVRCNTCTLCLRRENMILESLAMTLSNEIKAFLHNWPRFLRMTKLDMMLNRCAG